MHTNILALMRDQVKNLSSSVYSLVQSFSLIQMIYLCNYLLAGRKGILTQWSVVKEERMFLKAPDFHFVKVELNIFTWSHFLGLSQKLFKILMKFSCWLFTFVQNSKIWREKWTMLDLHFFSLNFGGFQSKYYKHQAYNLYR